MEIKLLKTIRIIAIIISILFLILAIWWTQDQVNFLRRSTDAYVDEADKIIIEWLSDYSEDQELLEQIDADLEEAQVRLDKLFKEAGID